MRILNFMTVALTLFTLSSPAWAFLEIIPATYEFGEVPQGQLRTAIIQILNQDALSTSVNVICTGDIEDFNCISSCFSVPAYGSCSVTVNFQPTQGNGMSEFITLQADAISGGLATSQISGTDAPAQAPTQDSGKN